MRKQRPVIEFRNVSVVRGEQRILDGISLKLNAGENVAIVGPNGSGKSSLIKVITRDYYPVAEEGSSVRLFGRETWDVAGLRRHFGIVSGDLQQEFIGDLTTLETVISGFFSSVGIPPQTPVSRGMRRKADELLEFLEVGHLSGRAMNTLSTGEARRILIARALVHDPSALILDEPMNGLDLHSLDRFRETLRRITRQGKSIVLVTHAIGDIIPEIRRVLLIKAGRVVADDRTGRVLTRSVLSRFFSVPLTVVRRGGYYHAL